MRPRDVTRVARASETMIERLLAAIEKLEKRKSTLIESATEGIDAIDEQLDGAFGRWSETISSADVEGEIVTNIGQAPAANFAVDELIAKIEELFDEAIETLQVEVEVYADIVKDAAEYDPDED